MGSDWVTHARPWVARRRPMGGHGRPMVELEFIRNPLGSLELVGDSYELLGNLFGIHRELLGIEWGTSREFVRFFGETVGYSWGVPGELVGNFGWEFVLWERSDTSRTHPHACNIPYNTALPVPCTRGLREKLFDNMCGSSANSCDITGELVGTYPELQDCIRSNFGSRVILVQASSVVYAWIMEHGGAP